MGACLRKEKPTSAALRQHAECIERVLVDVRGTHAHGAITGEEILLAGRERANCRERSIQLAILANTSLIIDCYNSSQCSLFAWPFSAAGSSRRCIAAI